LGRGFRRGIAIHISSFFQQIGNLQLGTGEREFIQLLKGDPAGVREFLSRQRGGEKCSERVAAMSKGVADFRKLFGIRYA
jgi:hypothetical protein